MNKKYQEELNKINEVIETIRFYVQRDGGDLFFLEYKDDIVKLKITGNCVGCSIQDVTYKDGLLQILKLEVPSIKDLILIEEKTNKKIN
ncbi:NifU family protein [bacterium]|nr:NifU family protein [bacterium]